MNQISCYDDIDMDGYEIAEKLIHLEVSNSMKNKSKLKNGCTNYYWKYKHGDKR